MAEPAELRLAVGAARRRQEAALRALRGAESHANFWREPDGSFPVIDPTVPGNEEAAREVASLQPALDAAAAELVAAESALGEANRAYDATATPLFDRDNGDPLLLLPVRLEAVYRDTELWIRVYPDDIHVDAHEPALTAAERDAGMRYWRAIEGADAPRRAAAWTELVAASGGNRAIWVRDVLTPQPEDGAFPDVEPRAEAWTRAARTTLLPDRFEFSAYRDGALVWRHQGADIPDTLPVGMAPPDGAEAPDGLPWDASSRWLVDFTEAVRKGMGLVVGLNAPDERFDLLTVVGVSDVAASRRVAECLSAHAYTGGLSAIQPGTPTNNTPGSRSGWRSREAPRDPDVTAAWRSAYDPSSGQDAARLAHAFGVDGHELLAGSCDPTAGSESLLRRMHELQGRFHAWSRAWRPPPGPILGNPAPVTDGWYTAVAEHYATSVRARGPLPSLRVGRQPYGVLPVSSTDLWRDFDRDALLAEGTSLLAEAYSHHPHDLPAQRAAAGRAFRVFLRLAALEWPPDQRRQIAESLRQLVGLLSPELPDDLAVRAAEAARAQFALLPGDQRFWLAVTWLGQAGILHPNQLDRQRAAAAEALPLYEQLADNPAETPDQITFLDTVAEHLRQLIGYLSPELPTDLAVRAADKARATWARLPGDHRFRIAVTWLGQAGVLHPHQLDRQRTAAAEALPLYEQLADGPAGTPEEIALLDTVAEHLRQLIGYLSPELPADLAVRAADKARATWTRLPGDHRYRIAVTWLGQAGILHPAQLDRQRAAAAESLVLLVALVDEALPLVANQPGSRADLTHWADLLDQLTGYLEPTDAGLATAKAAEIRTRLGE